MRINDDIQIFNGDCLEVMNEIPDGSVDLVLCDLPFGSTSCAWDEIIPFPDMWEQYDRLLMKKGNVVLFGTGLFAYKLALSNEKRFRYELIWKKSKCGSPFTAKYMPMKKHENILVFGESAAYYEPQMEKGTPYHRKWTPNKNNNLKFGINGTEHSNDGTRYPSTVLDFPQKWRRQDQVHPTQKPVELMEWLVKSYCPKGGIVLDNCMGSGTVGVACVNTDRRFIGIELEEKYFQIAKKRIEDALAEAETDLIRIMEKKENTDGQNQKKG